MFDHHYYWGKPGRYVFLLADGGSLDTRRFANGRYVVRATAEDFCGNVGTLSEPVTIDN